MSIAVSKVHICSYRCKVARRIDPIPYRTLYADKYSALCRQQASSTSFWPGRAVASLPRYLEMSVAITWRSISSPGTNQFRFMSVGMLEGGRGRGRCICSIRRLSDRYAVVRQYSRAFAHERRRSGTTSRIQLVWTSKGLLLVRPRSIRFQEQETKHRSKNDGATFSVCGLLGL